MRASDLRHSTTCVVIWRTTWNAITVRLGDVAPEVSMFWRFGLAGLMLAFYCTASAFARGTTLTAQRELFAMDAFMFCGAYLLIYCAERYLVSGLEAGGYSASPLVTTISSARHSAHPSAGASWSAVCSKRPAWCACSGRGDRAHA